MRWYRATCNLELEGKRYFRIIETLEGEVVGFIHVSPSVEDQTVVDMGILIEEGFQGRGIGRAAVRSMMEFSRGVLERGKMRLEVSSENVAALALYQKLQFRQVGSRRQDYDGRMVEVIVMEVDL